MATTLVSKIQNKYSNGKIISNSYFSDKRRIVRHQIDGFDNFIDNKIYEILDEYNSNPKNVIYADYDKELERNKLEYHIKFGKIYISRPIIQDDQSSIRQMFPNDARLQKLTYSLTLKVDIYHKLVEYQSNGQPKETEFTPLLAHQLGKIPLMLQSKYCVLNDTSNETITEMGEDKYDYGGYFIVNGNEKVIVAQERQAENIVYCFHQGKTQNKFSHKCEIRSVSENSPYNIKNAEVKLTAKDITSGKTIKVKIQGMRQELPLFVVFRALGVISDKQIVNSILYNLDDAEVAPYFELLRPSIEEASQIRDQQTALEYCSKYVILQTGIKQSTFQSSIYKISQTRTSIIEEFLPHLGNSAFKKSIFLGYMTFRLLQSYLNNDYADRDSFLNKRVDTTGEKMADLFRINFKKMMRDVEHKCRQELQRHRFDEIASTLHRKIKKSDIESGMKYGLSTGNWGLQSKDNKKGIARMLNRLSYLSFLSDMRKVQAPMKTTMKNQQPRLLHSTQWGRICPAETPEGAPVGIVKNLAMLTVITIASSTQPIREFIIHHGMRQIEDIHSETIYGKCKVFINGDWVGIHEKPAVLLGELRKMRRNGEINIYTSISWNIQINEIHISTEGGRLMRPLIIVENNRSLATEEILTKLNMNELEWDDLLFGKYVCIEYLDVAEENTAMIAMNPEDLESNLRENDKYYEYTHIEIDPNLMFGVIGVNGPFTDHQQAPRVIYYCAQSKQAVGIYSTTYENRFDTSGNVLYYPQKGLITTDNSEYTNINRIPNGQNIVVAIMCYTGYNQEDSVIVNKSSLDRGMFVSTYFRTYEGKEQKNQSTLEEEKFCKPVKYNPNGTPRTAGMKEGSSYGKLEENGFVKEGTRVNGGDAIIGKCIPLKTTTDDEIKYRDSSTFVKSTDSGIVDKVYVNKDGEGFKFGRVRVRSERIPEIGDKFCLKGDCEVMTTVGWIPIRDIGMDHRVATLVDGRIEYAAPEEVYSFEYNGAMYKVRSDFVDLDTTIDHDLYVRVDGENDYHRIRAIEVLGKKYQFKKNCDKDGEFVQENPIVQFGLSIRNGREKDFPDWVWALGKKQSRLLIDRIMDNEYKTDSKVFADYLMRLSIHAGISANVVDDNGGYSVVLNKDENEPVVDAVNESVYHYEGDVYCLRVPSHVFMIRQNMKNVWVGNCSRYANKSTCGITFTQEDMPYTKDGVVPDLIINPIGFPKRMTIGQLIETVAGKMGAMKGYSIDGTPFTKMDPNDLGTILEKECGFQRNGLEVLYNGRTGEQIESMIFVGPSYYHRLKHMVADKIHCLKPDHDVLTLAGWKAIPEITMDDEIACLVEGKLVYQKPMNVFHYPDYKGKMYRVSNSHVDLDTTANHRMYVSQSRKLDEYEFVRADEIEGKHLRYKKSAEWDAPDYQFVLPAFADKPERALDMEAWLIFFGMWITEGWTIDKKRVAIYLKKDSVKKVFEEATKRLGYEVDKIFGFKKWTIHDAQLANYMNEFAVGAQNKFLPTWVFNLSQNQARILVESIGNSITYSTKSSRLADQFTQLCLHAGWSATKTTHIKKGDVSEMNERTRVVSNYDLFRVSVNKKFNNPEVNRGHYTKKVVKEDELYDYEGPVHCVEVEGNVFMVRRNGKPVWTANSRSSGPYSQLVRQPSVGRARDGGLRVGEMEKDAMLSHGTVQFLKERMFDVSDKYFVTLCKDTGMIAAVNKEKNIYNSLYSNNNTDFVRVQIPYASKLLMQELYTIGIVMKLKTDAPDDGDKKKAKAAKEKEIKDL
jgi:DNA-directed RNA polymerase II subunit RPB2